MNLDAQLSQWVQLDNQIKELNERTRILREKRGSLEKAIASSSSSNQVIQHSSGKIKFVETRVQEPLTFKYLERVLGEIIKREDQAQSILEYIKKKREIRIVPEIKRIS
jgi:hypothetical protein